MEKLKNGQKIEIKIDFESMTFDQKTAKKMLHKLAQIRKQADFWKRQIQVKTSHGKTEDIHNIKNQYERDIYIAIAAIQIEDKSQRYHYLYDEICYDLDHICRMENLCDFKNDKCFPRQNTNITMGCCHHFPNKRFGIWYQKNLVPCEFLGKNGCTTKSIGCKLFMCDDVRKKGYHFTVYNVLLIRYFFNFLQKIIIRTSVFEAKEKIMKRLLKFNF